MTAALGVVRSWSVAVLAVGHEKPASALVWHHNTAEPCSSPGESSWQCSLTIYHVPLPWELQTLLSTHMIYSCYHKVSCRRPRGCGVVA